MFVVSVPSEFRSSPAQERRWRFMRAGREEEYHGVAVHPRHLSRYERYVLKCVPADSLGLCTP
jgi:hypothetical protein